MPTVTAFRLANWDTPLWASPNRRAGRFGREGDIVQYWTLHPATCWAEHLRFLDVRDPDEAKELLLRPWVGTIELPDSTLHVSFANAEALGLAPEALVDEDWTACQEWAAALPVGTALTVPSAALPGTRNLVLFGSRVRSRFGLAPFNPAVDVPCEAVADLSIAINDLLPLVRFRGAEHSGLVAWRLDDPEPLPPLLSPRR